MKAYDLKPTYENLIQTFRNDILGRNADIFRFTEILDTIEDGCSIALDGNWGSGKTFFVKQVKLVLDAHNNFIKRTENEHTEEIISARKHHYRDKLFDLQPQVSVYYDAWENDNDDDPVLSLVYAIMRSVETDFSFKERNYIKIGANIMEHFSGKNWGQLIESLKSTSPLEALKGQKDVEELVGSFLDSLLPEKGNRLIVFIDELDRCKPSYAVRLLERIKHYFYHDNITFVFSVNTNELQHTIKKHYGDEFDGSRYLDRFFDLRVMLPPPNLQNYFRELNFDEGKYTFDVMCSTVIKVYHFELREIAKFLRLAKIAAHEPTHGNRSFSFAEGRALQFCLHCVTPVMIGLRIQNANRYTAFIQGKDYRPLIEIITQAKELGFSELLNTDETFDPGDSSKTLVTLEDKLKALYDAIFVTTYGSFNRHHNTLIGKMEFGANTKDKLIRVTGLLSEFTKLDIE